MKLQTNPLCTIKKIDTLKICQYNPYKVYFKHHPMARKMGDCGDGVILICTNVNEKSVEFASLSRAFTDDGILHVDTIDFVDLCIDDIDTYKIEVMPIFTEEVTKILTEIKDGIHEWPKVLDENDEEQEQEESSWCKDDDINEAELGFGKIIDDLTIDELRKYEKSGVSILLVRNPLSPEVSQAVLKSKIHVYSDLSPEKIKAARDLIAKQRRNENGK